VARTAAKCTNAAADQTSTVINGGLVTTGTISFNDGSVTKAGMTAQGSGDANVRIWAGNTYANRASAAFRVTQGGAVTCSNITVTGGTWNGSDIAYGYIAANAVRTSELYIDGDINVGADGTYNKMYGIDMIYFGTGGTSSGQYIGRSEGSSNMILNSNAATYLQGNSIAIYGKTTTVTIDANTSIKMVMGSDFFSLNAATTTTGLCNYAGGKITLTISGVTRYIKLWKES
jgi:hypothetical protein